jgi:D-alanine transaminase
MIVYFNNQLIELSRVQVSPFDRGFLFADGVYETIRTYNGKLFRFADHIKRLNRSLNELQIKFKDSDELEKIIYQLVEVNNFSGKDILAYIQITRGISYPRKHTFQHQKNSPTVFISISELQINSSQQQRGVKVILQKDMRWLRCDIKSVSLLPAVFANQKAVEAGGVEAVLFRDDKITEGSHTNFFGAKNNLVITAPESNLILSGITREVVIELCKQMNIDLSLEFIKINELKNYDEFFITSTTKEIFPVVQINDWKVGNGSPGKITNELIMAFKELAAAV